VISKRTVRRITLVVVPLGKFLRNKSRRTGYSDRRLIEDILDHQRYCTKSKSRGTVTLIVVKQILTVISSVLDCGAISLGVGRYI